MKIWRKSTTAVWVQPAVDGRGHMVRVQRHGILLSPHVVSTELLSFLRLLLTIQDFEETDV